MAALIEALSGDYKKLSNKLNSNMTYIAMQYILVIFTRAILLVTNPAYCHFCRIFWNQIILEKLGQVNHNTKNFIVDNGSAISLKFLVKTNC